MQKVNEGCEFCGSWVYLHHGKYRCGQECAGFVAKYGTYEQSPAPESVAAPVDQEGAIIEERDYLEDLIQQLDIAAGFDGEFKAVIGEGVIDAHQMFLRIKDRLAETAFPTGPDFEKSEELPAPVDEVSAALQELREMFPGERLIIRDVTEWLDNADPDREFQLYVGINGLTWKSDTLTTVLQRVREWKNQEAGK